METTGRKSDMVKPHTTDELLEETEDAPVSITTLQWLSAKRPLHTY